MAEQRQQIDPIGKVATIWVVTICFAISFASGTHFATPMKERDVGKLIKEYLAPDTSDKRREELITKLKPAKPELAQKAIKKAIRKEDTREKALEIAVALKVPGLFKYTCKLIDSEDEQAIISLFLATYDEDGIELLLERLLTLEIESSSFTMTKDGFMTQRLPSKHLEQFLKPLKKDKRSDILVEVLTWQFDKEGLSKADLLGKWKKLAEESDRNHKQWEYKGTDVFELDGWTNEGTSRLSGNWKLDANSHMRLDKIPSEWLKGTWKITIRVAALEEVGAEYCFAFGSWQLVYRMDQKMDRWTTPDVDGSEFTKVPMTPGKWQEHVWTFKTGGDGKMYVNCVVDGKEMVNGEPPKALIGIQIQAHASTILFGGFDAEKLK